MAFMIPQYSDAPFVRIENENGESEIVPEFAISAQESDITERYNGKWFCRLSAPGYMDCTEWAGPFDNMDAAQDYIINTFDVDAIDGEPFEDE